MTRKRRLALAVIGSAVVIAFLAVAVFPSRLWLTQRDDLTAAERRVQVLHQTNAALQKRIDELGTDSAIERLAREQHNLVNPGEDAYAVLPPADDAPKTVAKPTLAPRVHEDHRGFLRRLRDRMSFWA